VTVSLIGAFGLYLVLAFVTGTALRARNFGQWPAEVVTSPTRAR
jgi:hypothetical protein